MQPTSSREKPEKHCSEYAVVMERFVETRSVYGWGLVCHALAGALRSVLGDWHLHVSQMEHQQLLGKLDLPVPALALQDIS